MTRRQPGLAYEAALPEPVRDGMPVAVLLHGRGSNRADLQGLRPAIPARVGLLTPEAPHAGGPWGYGGGWAWYRYVADDRLEPDTLHDSLEALDLFLDSLPQILGVRPGPVLMGGFSQGGTTSLAYALTRPGRLAGVLNFSGFLVDDPSVPVARETLHDTPIFWGHGRRDPAIPFVLAERGRARLAEIDAALTARDYPIGHWIDPMEAQEATRWMEEVLEARTDHQPSAVSPYPRPSQGGSS